MTGEDTANRRGDTSYRLEDPLRKRVLRRISPAQQSTSRTIRLGLGRRSAFAKKPCRRASWISLAMLAIFEASSISSSSFGSGRQTSSAESIGGPSNSCA
jgi:hypothetical protein